MSPPMNLWDEQCLKLSTAVKAIWILYRRGKWDLLECIGFPRKEYEHLFIKFDLQHITSEHGLLRTERQVIAVMHAIPGMALCGITLIEMYKRQFLEGDEE